MKDIKVQEIDCMVDTFVVNINSSSTKIKSFKEKAEAAVEAAQIAENKKITFFSGRREAIESLQSALIKQTDALVEITDTERQMFENIESLSKSTKALFLLGVSNTAMTRTVIARLRDKLYNNSSKEELNAEARKEIVSIIKQLKAQDVLHNKVSHFSKKLKIIEQKRENLEVQFLELKDEIIRHNEKLTSESCLHVKENKKLRLKVKRISVVLVIIVVLVVVNLCLTLYY